MEESWEKASSTKGGQIISYKVFTETHFDREINSTLTRTQRSEKYHPKTMIEDHQVIVEEPQNLCQVGGEGDGKFSVVLKMW